MKKGDLIERMKDMPEGTILFRNLPSEEMAEELMLHIEKHYNFVNIPKMGVQSLPQDNLCVVLEEPSFLSIKARVNWVVDEEMAIEYLDTGGMVILDMGLEENKGWVVIHEATPVYQDSVEHMTDEQLRESIEELRAKRLVHPVKTARAKSAKSQPVVAESPEDKALAGVLNSMDASSKYELMKKLGLVED